MNEKKPRATAPKLEPDQKKQLVNLQRRLMLRSGLTLGGIAMLTGCNLQDGDRVDKVLWAMSRWNDRVQAWLFSGQRLPQQSQITRLICIEGWSAIGQWGGVPLRTFLQHVGADLNAGYVGFKCADRYYSSLDMATALHPQTILALDFGGKALPADYGYPLRLRVPTKLGFKNAKHIAAIFVSDVNPGGYWEDQGYNWFSGI